MPRVFLLLIAVAVAAQWAPMARCEQAPKPAATLPLAPASKLKDCAGTVVQTGPANLKQCVKQGSGEIFRDCPDCPEMVVVPAGSFTMGTAVREVGREPWLTESPPHEVRIGEPFAVGKYAVTRDEFDAFVKDSGYPVVSGCNIYLVHMGIGRPDDTKTYLSPGFEQDGSHPAVCVNWFDAKAYLMWLSQKTGKTYRLLSEAEREYATRAGTATPFWWGAEIALDQANYNPNLIGRPRVAYRSMTVPANSYQPNPWGLYQVHGNADEWVEDCYRPSYNGAPPDGSAWTAGDCNSRVFRGGSWSTVDWALRSAGRNGLPPQIRCNNVGFRVARTLTP